MTQPQEIGLFDAKTHFSQIVARVEAGERFLITRHGKAVAEIGIPSTPSTATLARRKKAFENIRRIKAEMRQEREEKGLPPITLEEILQWRDEGRP